MIGPVFCGYDNFADHYAETLHLSEYVTRLGVINLIHCTTSLLVTYTII